MLSESGMAAREPGEMVTPPGGTTRAGRGALETHHFRGAVIAAIDGHERSATVTSETPMTLAIMGRPQLMEALRDDPDISYKLMVELARMFRAASAEAYG